MKITFDIDCTPEEARQFLGLPDVSELQKEAMEEVRKRMLETIQSSDHEALMKTWMPTSMQGFDQMQKMFWSQFSKDDSSKTTK